MDIFAPRLSFPTVNTGAGGDAGTQSDRMVYQIRDDVSLLKGNHALKMGVNFNYLWHLGIRNGNEHFATLPSSTIRPTILNNTQRPLSAGLPDAGHRPHVAAGQRRRGQRPGELAGHDAATRSSSGRGSRTTGASSRR